jgi:hypothetical protein
LPEQGLELFVFLVFVGLLPFSIAFAACATFEAFAAFAA